MRAGKLRAMVDRGGVPGALLVGGYLILHYAWHRRRPRLLIVVVDIFLLSGWLTIRPPASRRATSVADCRLLSTSSLISITATPRLEDFQGLRGQLAPPMDMELPPLLEPLHLPGAVHYVLRRIPIGMPFSDEYYWLSDDEILFFQWPTSSGQILRRNLSTGKETTLSQLSALYHATVGRPTIPLQISPDRQWLLWYDFVNGLYVARLDGLGYFTCQKAQEYAPDDWSPDSRSIMEICIARPRDGCWIETWKIGASHPIVAEHVDVFARTLFHSDRWYMPVGAIYDLSEMNYIGMLPGPRLLFMRIEDFDTNAREAAFYEVPLRGQSSTSRPAEPDRFAIHLPLILRLPQKITGIEVTLSPDKRRIAFLAGYEEGGKKRSALWVYGLHDRTFREVATFQNDPSHGSDGAGGLKWTPSGKRLSFIYQERLYTIPVPVD